MISSTPILRTPAALLIAACALFTGAVAASEFDPVVYDLRDGSVLHDDCPTCDRKPIEVPLRGSFVLTRLPVRIVGELYSVTDIDLLSQDPGGSYALKGSGQHYRRTGEETTTSLELEVNGQGGIALESGIVPPAAVWPALDVTVTEDGSRDPIHIFTIRIVAAPRAQPVLYRLVEGNPADFTGSFFIDDCIVCGRPTIPVPVGGTFLLTPVEVGGPNPFNSYRVEALDVKTVAGALDYTVQGEGQYVWGGEVALLQSMDLKVQVNGGDAVPLASGMVPFSEGARFPAIDIQVDEQDSPDFIVYRLHLVAKPAGEPAPPRFRRGDANGDGPVDISDGVFTLLWLFAGGSTPGCLDAADSDDDGAHALTDAIYTLNYLFRGGPAPPEPGPVECGSDAKPLGCQSYPPCGA